MEIDDACMVERLFCLIEDGVVEVEGPTSADVVRAVRGMDGADADTVSVTLPNGDGMDIGGGRRQQYVCHARIDGELFDLLDPGCQIDLQDKVPIGMNEEIYHYPRCCAVPLEMVLLAVETFAASGTLNRRLTWDSSLDYTPL